MAEYFATLIDTNLKRIFTDAYELENSCKFAPDS
jgi:hypothetical protein